MYENLVTNQPEHSPVPTDQTEATATTIGNLVPENDQQKNETLKIDIKAQTENGIQHENKVERHQEISGNGVPDLSNEKSTNTIEEIQKENLGGTNENVKLPIPEIDVIPETLAPENTPEILDFKNDTETLVAVDVHSIEPVLEIQNEPELISMGNVNNTVQIQLQSQTKDPQVCLTVLDDSGNQIGSIHSILSLPAPEVTVKSDQPEIQYLPVYETSATVNKSNFEIKNDPEIPEISGKISAEVTFHVQNDVQVESQYETSNEENVRIESDSAIQVLVDDMPPPPPAPLQGFCLKLICVTNFLFRERCFPPSSRGGLVGL